MHVMVDGKENKNGAKDKSKKEPRKYGRGQHPNSKRNLRPQIAGTPSHNPHGRPLGSRDRSTVLRELLAIEVEVKDPSDRKKKKLVTLYESAALGVIQSAARGNVFAFKEIQDTLWGPIPAKVEGAMDFSFVALMKEAQEVLNGHEERTIKALPLGDNGEVRFEGMGGEESDNNGSRNGGHSE